MLELEPAVFALSAAWSRDAESAALVLAAAPLTLPRLKLQAMVELPFDAGLALAEAAFAAESVAESDALDAFLAGAGLAAITLLFGAATIPAFRNIPDITAHTCF